IVPAFTANWLKARGETVMPEPHARYDSVAVGIGALGLALWVVDGWIVPAGIVGTILLGAAGLHLVRQLRWRPHRTLADPLVAVLHGAYLFVPVGFALAGLALIAGAEDVHRAAVHAWTVGAFGTMTLAMMTRASLGHTGRSLRASPATVIIYLSVLSAAATRIAASLFPAWSPLLSSSSAVAWIAAFVGYAVVYGPMLLAPRRAA
ncbi:MAG: NnrS family protein, partial [Rhodospirillales bacterium]|nr:NnrS family protein [Rhodospirillales bacterium]